MTLSALSPIRISVVIICHNQAVYIRAALDSVLDQTDSDCISEIIIVDDGSTDGSAALIGELANCDTRIVPLLRNKGSGGAATPRNDGISRATGTHIAFLDGDDLWLPDKIAHQRQALEQFPDIGLLFSDFIVFDEETGEERARVAHHYTATDTNTLATFFVQGGPAVPSCAIISREAVKAAGHFDPSIRVNEENEYWLRIAASCPIHHQPQTLIRKREWLGSLGSAKYQLENLACKRRITKMMVAYAPELAVHAKRRDAQIAFKTAVHYLALKKVGEARAHLHTALQLDPGFKKARLYLALSYLSTDPERLIGMLRRARTKMPVVLR